MFWVEYCVVGQFGQFFCEGAIYFFCIVFW